MNLSVCIIAKNEEKHIEKCMQCLSDKEVQIVVADTGSTDKTKEIAKLIATVHQHNESPEDLDVKTLISYGRVPHHKHGSNKKDEDEKISSRCACSCYVCIYVSWMR